jgi:hypothetical protein
MGNGNDSISSEEEFELSKISRGSYSLADPGCLSRIPDPNFYPSRIPDQKTATKERGEKKMCCHNFLCSHKFHKIASFEVLKKKIWVNFQKIIELITQKIFNKLSKIWVWDPRSGIRKKPIPDPGVKKDPDPQHWVLIYT